MPIVSDPDGGSVTVLVVVPVQVDVKVVNCDEVGGTSITTVPTVSDPEGGLVTVLVVVPVQVEVKVV